MIPHPEYAILGAQTEMDAATRYATTKAQDPFPDVPPALLNSAHLEDYMLETAMIFPYQRERRKTASYALRVGGKIAYYDPTHPDRGTFHNLKPFDTFDLPPNSLVYFQTKELFQLPNYMAVRFNLHIDLVHKGLLLGTGPLVDPGFSGRLVIPLHNMTANTYVIAEDDEVIWVEFTKTSAHPDWLPEDRRRDFKGAPRASFATFPSPKTGLGIADYFIRAREPHPSRPDAKPYPFPANAIPGTVEAARSMAEKAQLSAGNAAATAKRIQNFGIFAALVAGAAVFYPVLALVTNASSMVQTTTTMAQNDTPALAAMRRDLAYRDIEDARLLGAEYCAAVANVQINTAVGDSLLIRLRIAERRANKSSPLAGGKVPFSQLSSRQQPLFCPA